MNSFKIIENYIEFLLEVDVVENLQRNDLERIGDAFNVGVENELIEAQHFVLVDAAIEAEVVQISVRILVVVVVVDCVVVGIVLVEFLLSASGDAQSGRDRLPEFGSRTTVVHVVVFAVLRPDRVEDAQNSRY